jgi:hypothetical protein
MDISKEIQKLDMQIAGMSTVLENLKNMLNQDDEDTVLDIGKIEKLAVQAKFLQHITGHMDEELAYKYCVALASAVELIGDKDKKIRQYYYIFRIYHASRQNLISENFLRDAKIFSMGDWESLMNGILEEGKRNLFVDLVMMTSLDGNLDPEQINYLCEIFAYADYKKQDIEIVLKLAKVLLLCDENELYQMINETNINEYIPYLGSVPDYYVLNSFSQIEECTSPNVMVVDETITDSKKIIQLDNYGKKKIIFRNCQFEGIKGMKSKETESMFIDCLFENHEQKAIENHSAAVSAVKKKPRWEVSGTTSSNNLHLLVMNKSTFKNVTFRDCCVVGGQSGSVLKLVDSKVVNCKFENCKVSEDTQFNWPTGAILDVKTTEITDCKFLKCISNVNVLYN